VARSTSVEIPVAIILIIVGLGSVAELTVGTEESIDAWLVVLAAAPYLLSATCILSPRPRHLGLGLAGPFAPTTTFAASTGPPKRSDRVCSVA
jgi:hypothetical protein